MPADDPRCRLWRHVTTVDQHCDLSPPTAQPFDGFETGKRL
jgi:hypothetical protein